MQNAKLAIRRLTAADIPAALNLCAAANWNQTEGDWRLLLAFDPEGCFAAEIDGALAGTATTTRYEPARGPGSFAWIGMMLVDPSRRRSGIGSALLTKCIEFFENAGVETIKLDATALGKKVYDAFGFRDECLIERWEGPATDVNAPYHCALWSMTPLDLEESVSLDTGIFGARRERVLRAWCDAFPECAIVARNDGGCAGFALARRGARFFQIGPIEGRTPQICEALFCEELARIQEEGGEQAAQVVIDIVAGNCWAKEIAQRCGLTLQRPLIRMFRGPNASPGRMENILAICCPELG